MDYAPACLQWLCLPMPPCPSSTCSESDHDAYLSSAGQLGIICQLAECRGFDIRKMSPCATDEDCVLRWGLQCCELCTGDAKALVAVPKSAKMADMLCDTSEECCTPPPTPADAKAVCDGTKNCAVEMGP